MESNHWGLVIWHHRTWSALVQIIACHLFSSSHYLNQCCLVVNLISLGQTTMKFESKYHNVHSRKCIWIYCLQNVLRPFCPCYSMFPSSFLQWYMMDIYPIQYSSPNMLWSLIKTYLYYKQICIHHPKIFINTNFLYCSDWISDQMSLGLCWLGAKYL